MPPTPSHHRTAVQYFLLKRTGLLFATGLCTVFCVLVLVLFPKDQVTSNCECLPDGTVCCIEASSSCGMGQCYCGPAVGSSSSNPDENYCTVKITTETTSSAGLFASGAMLVITSCFLLFLLYGYRVDTREWKEHAQEHHPEQEQAISKQQQENTINNNNHTATSTNINDGNGGDIERQQIQQQQQHPQQEQKQPETSDVDALFIMESTPSSLPRIMEHSSELRMTMDEEEDHTNHNHNHPGNPHSEPVVPELPIPIQLQQSIIQTQQQILSLPSLDHGPLVEETQQQQHQQSPRQQPPPTQTPPAVIPVPNQPQAAPQPITTTSRHDHADPNTAEWVLEEDETSC